MKLQPLDFEKPISELEQSLDDLRRQSRENNVNLDFYSRLPRGPLSPQRTRLSLLTSRCPLSRLR